MFVYKSKVVLALVFHVFPPSLTQPMSTPPLAKRKKKSIELIFQRWISWFPQRWRTPRNAIRNANCRIKWVIKSLNANCCSDYFSGSIPGSDSVNHHNQLHVGRMGRVILRHAPWKTNDLCRFVVVPTPNRSRYCSATCVCELACRWISNKLFGAELR